MNVRELIEALKQCPPHAKIEAWNSADNNEFAIHVVTKTKSGWPTVLLADCDAEVSVSEIIIHADPTEQDGQFGAGA